MDRDIMPIKPWWRSKIFWINALTLAASIIGIVAASEFVRDNPQLVLVLTGLVIPVINVILRWLTDEPISSWFPSLDTLRRVQPNADRSKQRADRGERLNHLL